MWRPPPELPIPPDAIAIPDPGTIKVASGPANIFEKLRFQKVHQDLQHSYLQLIDRISDPDVKTIDVKDRRGMYVRYQEAQRTYQETLRKVADHEKDLKLQCFTVMKSLIRGIMFIDQKAGKKLTRYEPEALQKEGIFGEIPKCPGNGTYSIIVRNDRRFFHCSKHGILRN
jgi:hypothetical protein